jgi:peptidoglycan biosynthesis protein MviN/MurJ (putative lipid II flippase)
LGGIFNLIVSLLLVWKIGIYGVAWGTVAELGIVSLFALPWLICRLSGIPLGEYVRMLLLDLVLASIPVVAFWLAIRGSLKADYLVICWQAAFYVLACVVWYWWVLFRKADREQTLNLLLPRRQPDKHES